MCIDSAVPSGSERTSKIPNVRVPVHIGTPGGGSQQLRGSGRKSSYMAQLASGKSLGLSRNAPSFPVCAG